MEWLKRINNAIDYIEHNLDSDISYDEAAQIACCSTYYFQRMFSYITGISLAEYIKRRRMTQAAFELQRTNKRVLEIALKYGYTSLSGAGCEGGQGQVLKRPDTCYRSPRSTHFL
ncbi:AraC family transcriptional regulator [Clostridium sp. AF27-5AA]|nr:AraC family transcriptional regulator [Clostridium sp. AF27-5AA]